MVISAANKLTLTLLRITHVNLKNDFYETLTYIYHQYLDVDQERF